jgi:hypothetical protein
MTRTSSIARRVLAASALGVVVPFALAVPASALPVAGWGGEVATTVQADRHLYPNGIEGSGHVSADGIQGTGHATADGIQGSGHGYADGIQGTG